MPAVAIIPARLGSTRFPRKVLARETGRPLIHHVVRQALAAKRIARVVVATDAEEVALAVRDFGGEVVMTGEHPNGTSRLAEAARHLELPEDAIVVNVQGDEPEVEPEAIDLAIESLQRTDTPMATIASPFNAGQDPGDPNIVKVVIDARGRALYFSRSPIPFLRGEGGATPLRHVGLYAYRRSFLDRYVTLAATPLEISESLEQLRALEHGHAIAVGVMETRNHGIDTPEQYARFVERWRREYAS